MKISFWYSSCFFCSPKLLINLFNFCSGCFIAASAYENRLAMFSVSLSGGSDIIDKVELRSPLPVICFTLMCVLEKITYELFVYNEKKINR